MTSLQDQSTRIWVTFAKHGVHHYSNAPDDVNYLRAPHRHLFKFKATIAVYTHDREIEFHQFQNWLMSLYADGGLDLSYQSCEMLANNLLDTIEAKYPGRPYYAVEVSEDGECGAEVIRGY